MGRQMRSPQRKLWEFGRRKGQPVKRAKEETNLSPRWGCAHTGTWFPQPPGRDEARPSAVGCGTWFPQPPGRDGARPSAVGCVSNARFACLPRPVCHCTGRHSQAGRSLIAQKDRLTIIVSRTRRDDSRRFSL